MGLQWLCWYMVKCDLLCKPLKRFLHTCDLDRHVNCVYKVLKQSRDNRMANRRGMSGSLKGDCGKIYIKLVFPGWGNILTAKCLTGRHLDAFKALENVHRRHK